VNQLSFVFALDLTTATTAALLFGTLPIFTALISRSSGSSGSLGGSDRGRASFAGVASSPRLREELSPRNPAATCSPFRRRDLGRIPSSPLRRSCAAIRRSG
jgi:hypothetical protein